MKFYPSQRRALWISFTGVIIVFGTIAISGIVNN
jgi:hypothetical protein